jgi:hypothetical protein
MPMSSDPIASNPCQPVVWLSPNRDERDDEPEERGGVLREHDGHGWILRVQERRPDGAARAHLLELGERHAEREALEHDGRAEHDVAPHGRAVLGLVVAAHHADEGVRTLVEGEDAAEHEDQDADHERPEVTLDRVSEGMEQRRGFFCAAQADEQERLVRGVGDAVDRLRHRREAAGEERRDELRERDEGVTGEGREDDARVAVTFGHGARA